MWEKTALLIQEKPFTGVGAGNWRIIFPKNGVTGLFHESKQVFFKRPHNDFLWVFSENGLFGFLAYVGMFLSAFFMGIKSFIKGSKDTRLNVFATLFFYTKNNSPYSFQLPLKIKGFVLSLIALVGLFFSLVVGYYCYNGEKFMRIAQYDNIPTIKRKRLLNQAKSPFFTLDLTGFPVSWYEGIIAIQDGNHSKIQAYFMEAYRMNPYKTKPLFSILPTTTTTSRTSQQLSNG